MREGRKGSGRIIGTEGGARVRHRELEERGFKYYFSACANLESKEGVVHGTGMSPLGANGVELVILGLRSHFPRLRRFSLY